MYETQNKVSHEKAEEFDEEYFSKQLLSDLADIDDVNMEELDKELDFDFMPNPKNNANQQLNFLVSRIEEASRS